MHKEDHGLDGWCGDGSCRANIVTVLGLDVRLRNVGTPFDVIVWFRAWFRVGFGRHCDF